MAFEVSGDAYGRFMGRYSEPLAVQFAQLAQVGAGQRVLDVGCGPGALVADLVKRVGVDGVTAVDPSAAFVSAAQARFPGVDVRSGVAEALPFADDVFDASLAQLVVHFMTDPVRGLQEMARVTRPGGLIAACVWDHAGGRGPLSAFWQAAHDVDPQVHDESGRAGVREGDLAALCAKAGLADVEASELTVQVRFESFAEWWEPYTLGVGPAGDYVTQLDASDREALRSRAAQLLPPGSFDVAASAWCVRARV
jgi:ubiquinone/menaquinone biosynthesis C-methylase UbiE